MVHAGLARTTVNARIGRIVRMFAWAAEEETVPPRVRSALREVRGLREGRSEARETAAVRTVPDAWVDAVRPHVSRQVWAMIQLQRHSAMRPNEVCRMRTGDLDVRGRVWVYRPPDHKTAHRGRERLVYLGPQAQDVLRPWLRPNLTEFIFQPREAEAERKVEMRRNRQTPVQPLQHDRSKANAQRRPGDHYVPRAYCHAIHRGCRRAGVPVWGPNRLRHLAATVFRREAGLDVAQVLPGHSRPETTLIYAEADRRRAEEAVLRIG
jgi:integrase